MRWLLTAVVLSLAACATGPDESPRAQERYVIIDTGASRMAEGIFPVVITRIDDRRFSLTPQDLRRAETGRLPGARYVHRVQPGVHTIEAVAVVDRRFVPGPDRDLSRDESPPLTYSFESGLRYFIGLEADSPRRADWRLVIWKVEETESGTLDLGVD